jgi:hypothetical protein
VRITGINLSLLDLPAAFTQEFNRWYDLDHLPEHTSKDDVLSARRYVATPALQRLEGVESAELTGGHPPYATVYFFGGPLEIMGEQAMAGWRDKDRTIIKSGRFFTEGAMVFGSWWTLAASRARRSIHISDDAIAHLPHQAIIVMLGRAPSPDAAPDAVAWWDRTQADDIADLPGVLASLRFLPTPMTAQDLVLHVLLCGEPATDVMGDLVALRRYQRLTGRYPAHKGIYETVALLPYQTIIPLQYDFEMSGETC